MLPRGVARLDCGLIALARHDAGGTRLVDAEDGAGRHSGVNVGGPVKGVENDNVVAAEGLLNGDRDVLLLRGNDGGAAAIAEGSAENIVGNDVQLLLVLALDVRRALETGHVGDTGACDERSDLLARGGNGAEHHNHLVVDVLQLLLRSERVKR